MERFEDHQRVVVVNPDHNRQPLKGRTGTVVRLRIADNMAWVNMDEPLPEEFCSFTENDGYGQPEIRRNHILLDPAECEPNGKSGESKRGEKPSLDASASVDSGNQTAVYIGLGLLGAALVVGLLR